jgi:thioredoxin-related protein
MRKQNLFMFLVIALTLYYPGSLQSQGTNKSSGKEVKIKWYSFEDAYKLNKKKPKKTFIDVYTEWCGWCKKMDAETFANPVIADYMNKHFYCVKLDAERKDTVDIDGVKFVNPTPSSKRSTHQLANEMLRGQMSYPSYTFLNEKGQIITIVPGYQAAPGFECIINYFGEDSYLSAKWEDYQSTFQGKLK